MGEKLRVGDGLWSAPDVAPAQLDAGTAHGVRAGSALVVTSDDVELDEVLGAVHSRAVEAHQPRARVPRRHRRLASLARLALELQPLLRLAGHLIQSRPPRRILRRPSSRLSKLALLVPDLLPGAAFRPN